jgi:hypothetical protein
MKWLLTATTSYLDKIWGCLFYAEMAFQSIEIDSLFSDNSKYNFGHSILNINSAALKLGRP